AGKHEFKRVVHTLTAYRLSAKRKLAVRRDCAQASNYFGEVEFAQAAVFHVKHSDKTAAANVLFRRYKAHRAGFAAGFDERPYILEFWRFHGQASSPFLSESI